MEASVKSSQTETGHASPSCTAPNVESFMIGDDDVECVTEGGSTFEFMEGSKMPQAEAGGLRIRHIGKKEHGHEDSLKPEAGAEASVRLQCISTTDQDVSETDNRPLGYSLECLNVAEISKDTLSVEELRLMLVQNEVDPAAASQFIYNIKARDSLVTQLIQNFAGLIDMMESNEKFQSALNEDANGAQWYGDTSTSCPLDLEDGKDLENDEVTVTAEGDVSKGSSCDVTIETPPVDESKPREDTDSSTERPVSLRLNLDKNLLNVPSTGYKTVATEEAPAATPPANLAPILREHQKCVQELLVATKCLGQNILKQPDNVTDIPVPVVLAELGRCRESHERIAGELFNFLASILPKHNRNHRYRGYSPSSRHGNTHRERFEHGNGYQPMRSYRRGVPSDPGRFTPRGGPRKSYRQENHYDNNRPNDYNNNRYRNNKLRYYAQPHQAQNRPNHFQHYRNFLHQVQSAQKWQPNQPPRYDNGSFHQSRRHDNHFHVPQQKRAPPPDMAQESWPSLSESVNSHRPKAGN